MHTRSFLPIAIALIGALVSVPLASAAARPNIIVVLCDDLGRGDLSCYGHPIIETPHLDQLAANGLRFTDCYSSSPVCSPSRAGLFTGRNPNRAGIYDWIAGGPVHLRSAEVTLPELLKGGGYETMLAGKWHLNGRFNKPDEQPTPGKSQGRVKGKSQGVRLCMKSQGVRRVKGSGFAY